MKPAKINLLFILLLHFLLLLCSAVFAGNKSDSLALKGSIFNNDSRVQGVVVNIYIQNKLFKAILVKSQNRFMTNLPMNALVTIEITAPDFHTKRFIIDTKVSENLKKSQLKYEFDIDIFKEEELANINSSFLDFPVGLVSYDEKKKAFQRDKKYTKRMKKAYLKLWEESQSAEAQRQSEGLK
jgi:hypothetical protein